MQDPDTAIHTPIGGSGALAESIARCFEDHGGEIRHMPREGGGSIFQISIPLEDIPA